VSPVGEHELEREIARSLVDALEAALAPGGTQAELRAARDAAQVLSLPGLDHLMSALAPHAARPWPGEIRPVVERLRRVSARAAAAGELEEFRRADADFFALAGEIVAMEWSALPSRGSADSPSVATLIAAEMLSDLPLAGEDSASVARRVRLTMPVAAAVRAALDWLSGRAGLRRPLELRGDPSALEIGCELRDVAGVRPAHEVLSSVGGSLGPVLGTSADAPERSWILRVPSFGARPTYIMLEQGPLRLAVPWHAVLKLQVVRRDAIESRAARLGMSVLPPLAPLAARTSETPTVIVAHGLKRAWMVADRLVWRLAADACEPGERLKEAGLTRAVSTEEGEVFGLVDPGVLLAGVPLPALPVIPGAPVAPEAAPSEAEPAPRIEPVEAEAAAMAAPSATELPEELLSLDEGSVTPLGALDLVEEPAAEPTPEETEEVAEEPAPEIGAWSARPSHRSEVPQAPARRVLVAEDSITARIFLTRLFEKQGFEVFAVERSTDLHAALASGPWSLVCVDVELPDARGAQLLREVRDRLPDDSVLVALARDNQDIAAARVAGVRRTLLKPVEPGALRRLLDRMGLLEPVSE